MKYIFILIFALFSTMSFAGKEKKVKVNKYFKLDSLSYIGKTKKIKQKKINEWPKNDENDPTLESVLNTKEKNIAPNGYEYFTGHDDFTNQIETISCKTQWNKQGTGNVEKDELNRKDQDSAGGC